MAAIPIVRKKAGTSAGTGINITGRVEPWPSLILYSYELQRRILGRIRASLQQEDV